MTTIDLVLGLFGAFSAIGMLGPQIWKIAKRQKAQDHSKLSAGLGASCQLVWFTYSCHLGDIPLIVSNATWAAMLLLNMLFIWKYQIPTNEPINKSMRSDRA